MLKQRPGASQEAFLRLEKGSDPPNNQLHAAAQLVGVDLKLCASHPETHRNAPVQPSPAPKVEWALRWLLKKLKNGKNYRVEPTSFLFLRQLLDMISPKNLASTLKDYKFLSILCDTVADLEADIFATVRSGKPILGSGSDSSQTLDSSSPEQNERGAGGQGKKRKRAAVESGDDAADLDERPPNPASCLQAFTSALDCLYGVVMLAQQMVNIEDVANSRLKLVLRGDPAVIARLLGKSLQVAAVAITEYSKADKTTDLQHLIYVFPAMLELWEVRSYRDDDKDSQKSNGSFAQSCFAHALRLQLCLRAVKLDTDERTHLLVSIERIVALHVLLPARAAFLARGGSGIDYSQEEPDWSSVQPVTDAFRRIIRENPMPQVSQNGIKDIIYPLWRPIELLPELFDNAVRAVARDSFRRQTQEAPWLETLFVSVAELAYTTAKEDDPLTYSAKFVLVLEDLLRVAIDRNIGLSLHTVLYHSGYTGLVEPKLDQVEWNVTALIVRLGVDVFLPNSGLSDARRLLDALLEKIMLQWRNDTSQDSSTYNTIKNDIVIPVMKGFAAARDLSTFIELWQKQLVAFQEARQANNKLPLFSVWEDDDLCNAYCEATRASLTRSHVVTHMRNIASDVRAENGKVSGSAQSYAKFVVMEASLRSKDLVFAESDKMLNTLLETVTATLQSKQHLHWRWRLWRFLRNLLHSPLLVAVQNEEILRFMSIAEKTISRNHNDLKKSTLAPLESWEAYRFALEAFNGSPNDDHLVLFTAVFEEVSKFVVSISPAAAQKLTESPWNGRADTLETPKTLALAYIMVTVRVPEIWARIPSDHRKRLLQQLLSLAGSQYCSSPLPLEAVTDDSRFLQAWASVVSHEYLLSVPSIVPDLVSILINGVENDTSNRRFYVESMQRIPAALITRGLRTTILNKLHDIVLQQDSSSEAAVGLLTMLAKLAAMPKADATLTSHWEPIWATARAIKLEGNDFDLQVMKAFRSLHRAVIAKLLVLNEEDRIDMFTKLFARVSKQTSKMRQIDRDSMACFLLRLSLSELWIHRKQLCKAVSEKELGACRERVFSLVLADMKSVKEQCRKQKLEETITLIKTIDALEDFEDLMTNNTEVEKFLSKIEKYMEMAVDSGPSRLIRRRILGTQGPDSSTAKPVLQCAETLVLQSLYAEDQQLFIRATSEHFRSKTPEQIGQAISEVRTLGLTGDHAGYRMLVIYLAVMALLPVEDKESELAAELSQLCVSLARAIVKSASIHQFIFAAECLALLLRVHTRSLTQTNIDEVLGAIAACASREGPRISSQYASTIYSQLCRLMGLVLGLQRLKIGGRFHLVNTAMERLQGCLFAPSRKRSRSARSQPTLRHPLWLTPLQASDTTNYTRLLTSLCDPTVSAVLRPQAGASREALTDETKKAKRIAGQYLQYVVMAYTQNSLLGTLQPDVKAALMPGLYSALDVMSKEGMRALNAGLDVSGRSVFKSLYDDYVKFGKWNKA